ncbi:MAG TPA: shikimate dehydrogenase [Thermoleophilaceae bacterium]|nr:shikimate dehydrogenase [Thermoleophilaceae bacterium]
MARTLLGVAGFPVEHSRSPAMHNAALAALGLDWLYVPLPLAPERFDEAAVALEGSGFRGINVTVPHKVAAHDLAHERSQAAQAIGAANTLTFGYGRIAADNTDAGGFLDALGEPPDGQRALVLGAGGSARAVVWALVQAGAAEVSVLNRTPERAAALAGELGARKADRAEPADLLVNCTSVGLGGRTPAEEAVAELGLGAIDPPATVVDLVYGDGPAPLAAWAAAAGSRVVEGLEVLVHQGARSLELWTAREAPIEVMRQAVGPSYQADGR